MDPTTARTPGQGRHSTVWRTRDVAEFWQRTPTTINRWVEAGNHPPPRLDPGGHHYWLPEEVEAFAGRDGQHKAAAVEEVPPLELVIGSAGCGS